MKKTTTPEEIEAVLAEAMPEVDVVDVDVTGGSGNTTLRVFIDHPDGVDHELCVKVTGLLDRYLKDHAVEVSSPGLERRLRKPEHFLSAAGEKINVKTYGPVQGQRNFTGFLIDAGENGIVMDLGDRVIELTYDQVARAKKLFEFPDEPGPGDGKKKKSRRQ
ncbi:MAG: ribosome maturation factor RimP [Gaiellales bacterium]|nr:MAG: ribosome maturation factor RimP [Gaiellales bacterium]